MLSTQNRAQAELEIRRRKRGRKSLLPWVREHRSLLRAGVPFDLVEHRYLRDIYSSKAQRLVIFKAGQMGASEYAISYALHACDERNATVLYVFPTDTHVSDFSMARLGPALEASPYLDRIVKTARERGADRVTLKRVRDRFLYFRGGQVKPDGKAAQLKSVDADVLVLDELDEMDARAPEIADKRLDHSLIAERRYISTPTYAGVGIHQRWAESDQREWFITCTSCGERQFLTIEHVVTEQDDLERPTAWHGQAEGRAFAACHKCGSELDRTGPGEWVAAYPDRRMAGFHLSKLFSAQMGLSSIVENLMTTDETKRKETINQDLGLPYSPRGGRITDETLDACQRIYGHGPRSKERCLMGVDVGKMLHVVVRGPMNEQGERPQRYAGTVGAFDDVGRLMKQYRVTTCVIDALPETRAARSFQASFRGKVWLAYYTAQKVGSKHEEPAQWNDDEGVVNVDRTRMLDDTFGRFYDEENTLPGHAKDVPDYYDHMKASVRVVEKTASGDTVARYVETGSDHYAHAENYCTVATMRPRGPIGALAQGKTKRRLAKV